VCILTEQLFFDTIPCLPPGAICDLTYIIEKAMIEEKKELGTITIDPQVEDWEKNQFFEITLRRYGTKYGKLLLETVWKADEKETITQVTGEYWGSGSEYERRYKEAANVMVKCLEQLKAFAERYCQEYTIKVIIEKFSVEILHVQIRW